MVSAGSDGSVKIWNFSNGSSLKNLNSIDDQRQVDREVTSLLCVYNPLDDLAPSFFVAAGWDKRLRIWPDDRTSDEENVRASRDLPTTSLS